MLSGFLITSRLLAEESLYEVEVTLDDGSQVDVQLDADFRVVGDERDEAPDDD